MGQLSGGRRLRGEDLYADGTNRYEGEHAPLLPQRLLRLPTSRMASALGGGVPPAAALIPFANNARTHSDAQVAQIAASIREFGWTNPSLVNGDNGIVAGHEPNEWLGGLPHTVARVQRSRWRTIRSASELKKLGLLRNDVTSSF